MISGGMYAGLRYRPRCLRFYRTFPHHAFFTDGHGIGQENLFNVLKAYSL